VNHPGRPALRLLGRFRFEFLAIVVVAVAMAVALDHVGLQSVSGVVPMMGVVVAIFIGFRNRNAYARWWEARTLWATVLSNGRSLHYALLAYEDGTPAMAAITDRIRRREVRHAWQLADELHGAPGSPRLADLTPEDPAGSTATDLLRRQGVDIGELSAAGMIDRQARRVLVTINSAQVSAATGLERIRSQPTPPFYALFTRTLAWFYAVVVCTGLTAGGHDNAAGIVLSVLVMSLFVMAERIGSLLDDPLTDDDFGLPLERFCATLTTDLLGPSPGLSRI
jgi:putative membrane protein